MKKIDYDALKAFCECDNCLRPTIAEPRKVNGYWVATDNKILLFADETLCNDNIEPKHIEGKYPDVFAVCNPKKVVTTHRIELSDILDALSKCPQIDEEIEVDTDNELEKCEVCYGNGEINDSVRFRGKYYYYSCECPVCHGFGKVPVSKDYDPDDDIDPEDFQPTKKVKTGKQIVDPYYILNIGNHYFSARNISKIIDFISSYGIEWLDITINSTNMLTLQNDGITICCMAYLGDLKDKPQTVKVSLK